MREIALVVSALNTYSSGKVGSVLIRVAEKNSDPKIDDKIV
jgi:hypothetical protein